MGSQGEERVRGAQGLRALVPLGLLGGLPLLGAASPDPALAWAWAALAAAPAGALVAGRGSGRSAWDGAALAAAAGLWLLVLPGLPRLGGALLGLLGLALLGAGLGTLAPERRGGLALLLLLLGGLLMALPSGAGLLGPAPWSPAVAGRLLAASPATLVLEAGGLDWLRHPAVYDPVGADSLGPGQVRPWGSLAGGVPGVVGFAAVAWRLAFRRAPRSAQE